MRLDQIYEYDEMEDEREVLFHALSEDHLEFDFDVKTIDPGEIEALLVHAGDVSILEAYRLYGTEDQREIVDSKVLEFDPDRIVILDSYRVVDGYHHLVAASISRRDVRVIQLDDAMNHDDPEPGS